MYLWNRINASIHARFIYPWKQANYQKTAYGKQLAAWKGKYSGQRCFLVGNGPSLRAEDLTTLHKHGEITFGFNRIYNIFDQTPWRPDFYVSQDEKILAGCSDVVSSLDLPVKLIPAQLDWYHGIQVKSALYFNIIHQHVDNSSEFLFSDDIAKGIYGASTGMYTAVQAAVYMGFSEIYFIGVDHHFRISQNLKGEIVVDPTVKDYFSENYNPDKDKLDIPNTERSTLTYLAIKKNCDQRKVKVFNATRGGKLEVFPRIDFDSLFA